MAFKSQLKCLFLKPIFCILFATFLHFACNTTSGMKLVYDQNYKLKDILVDGVSIDFDKKYSILLSDSTDVSNPSLASAWVSIMSKQDQPSKPEDYIEIGK